jgi:hypothetical protein
MLEEPRESNGETTEALVVARVRIPPALAFAVVQSVNATMAAYEAAWGEIRAPQPRNEGASE